MIIVTMIKIELTIRDWIGSFLCDIQGPNINLPEATASLLLDKLYIGSVLLRP